MSIFASILRSVYKLSGAKKAFALPEDALRKEIEKQNRHRGVFMPTDRKAYYETIAINGFPCLIVREHPKPSERAILHFFGGGMVIGPDKGDLPVMRKLCRETGCDVWFPFYPLCMEHCITETYAMVYECYRKMITLYGGGNVSTCGFSSGGALALGIAAHNNAQPEPLPQPRHIVAVYGIFFSLVFNFVYRGIMADAYTRLTTFLETFHECTEPPVSQVDENMNAMLIYQANMANSMKSIMELMKCNEESQIKGLDKIVQQFMNQLSESLGTEFDSLGRNLKDACEAQSTYARNFQRLEESTRLLLDASRAMQDSMQLSLERQQHIEEKLNRACENLGNELYTFHQMRDLYEK